MNGRAFENVLPIIWQEKEEEDGEEEAKRPVSLTIECHSDLSTRGTEKVVFLRVEARNLLDEYIDGGLRVVFFGDDFFEERVAQLGSGLGSGASISCDIDLVTTPCMGRPVFPLELTFALGCGMNSWHGKVRFSTGVLRGDFMTGSQFGLGDLNILAVGGKGHGKSSTLNSLLTILCKRDVVAGFSVAKLADHVTNSFSSLPAGQVLRSLGEDGCEKIPFVFFDIWGTDDRNYEEIVRFFPEIVDGRIRLHAKRDALADAIQPPVASQHIHGLLQVVQLAAYLDPQRMAEIEMMTQLWASLGFMGPIIVVAGIDKIEDEDLLREHKAKMLSRLPPNATTFFVENYTDQQRRDAFIDSTMRDLLLCIQEQATYNKLHIHSRTLKRQADWPLEFFLHYLQLPDWIPQARGLYHSDFKGFSWEQIVETLRTFVFLEEDIEKLAPALIHLGDDRDLRARFCVNVSWSDVLAHQDHHFLPLLERCIIKPTALCDPSQVVAKLGLILLAHLTLQQAESVLFKLYPHYSVLAQKNPDWDVFVPEAAKDLVCVSLRESQQLPSDFSESSLEEIVDCLQGLGIDPIFAKSIARKVHAHFSNE